MHFKLSLMCFQECWLSDNDDKSHLQIDGYDCITQGKTCGNKGGLVMQINNCFNYKIIMTLNQFDHWEGQIVQLDLNCKKALSLGISHNNIFMHSPCRSKRRVDWLSRPLQMNIAITVRCNIGCACRSLKTCTMSSA